MEPDELLAIAVEVCSHLGLRYLVVGSVATIAYGEPRFTNDINIALDLPPSLIEPFCEKFPAPEFYLSHAAVGDAVRRGRQFNLIHPSSGLKIDFMVLTQNEFDQSRISRRRELPALEGRTVSFASPEDVIVKKLVYFKEGGSEKHLRDITGVLRIQRDRIDYDYISRWAARFDASDVWTQVLAATNSPPQQDSLDQS